MPAPERARLPRVRLPLAATANGRPGIHHVLSRFQGHLSALQDHAGHTCSGAAALDTHGLPVEIEWKSSRPQRQTADRGLRRRGVQPSLPLAGASRTERMTVHGLWVTSRRPMSAFTTTSNRCGGFSAVLGADLLYQGYKSPYCPRCGTPSAATTVASYKEGPSIPASTSSSRSRARRTPLLAGRRRRGRCGNVALTIGEKLTTSRCSTPERVSIWPTALPIRLTPGYEVLGR